MSIYMFSLFVNHRYISVFTHLQERVIISVQFERPSSFDGVITLICLTKSNVGVLVSSSRTTFLHEPIRAVTKPKFY